MHPLRLQRFLLSDLNPAMWPVRAMAEAVRKDRRPAAADNALVERRACGLGADRAGARPVPRDPRARCRSSPSRRSTTRRWSRRSPACGRRMPTPRKPRARDEHAEQLLEAKIEAITTREEQGGFVEAVLRIMLAVAQAEHMLDARGFRLAQRIKQEHPRRCAAYRASSMKAAAKEQAFMLRFDQERALAALPRMLPTEDERREALEHRAARSATRTARSAPEGEAVLARIERDPGPRPAGAPSAAAARGSGRRARRRRRPERRGQRDEMKEQDPAEIAPPQQAGARVSGLSGADRALRRARAGDHGGRASLRRVLADGRGRGRRGRPDPADPGRARGQDPGRRRAVRPRHRGLTGWSMRRTATPPPPRRSRSCARARPRP